MPADNTEQRPRVPRAAAAALAWPARGTLPAAKGGALGAFVRRQAALEVEQRRLFPWLAVAFGAGILLFFAAEGRPALWAPVLVASLGAAAAMCLRGRPLPFGIALAIAAFFAGFSAGVVRARSVEAPALDRTVVAPLRGIVEAIEERPDGARLTVRVLALDRVPPGRQPKRVRVTARDVRGLGPGQEIAATARLLPPPEPAWPGGYDFARDARYRGIGAVGSLVGDIAASAPAQPLDLGLRLAAGVDAARNALTQRIAASIGGQAGAVSAALVTGKRGLIEEPTNDILRAAGIYHIVSISGLHMVLAAGTIFWSVRALLALSATAALMWPVKKIAALAAMVGAGAYCIFSGSEVATERSLVMTLVMFGAMLVDRPALSVRNLAIAAVIVLAREPETLIGPSFQMSFGAVAALIALSPLLQLRAGEGAPSGPLDRAWRWALRAFAGLVAMTLVASLATAPFAAYHFQTLNPFGLVGNGLALPLVSLAVMPAALLGVLAYPFGLDGPVWWVMGLAVDQVLAVSAWVSGFEGSNVVVPAFGAGALALFSGALLVATLPASALRWLAVLPSGAGLALAATPPRYDLFVDREGAGAAVRGRDGALVILGKPSDFVVEQWLRADGDGRGADDAALRQAATCDPAGCVAITTGGRAVAYVTDRSALEEDCRRAAVVITRLDAPGCGAPLVLDRPALLRRGATAARFGEADLAIRSTRLKEERRPWRGPAVQAAPMALASDRPRPPRPSIDLPDGEEAVSTGEPD
ncbi:MAG TPA: ComEC/Rec2 family competence protein [Microvirga sp.]|jgi:competence protein ComEC|nr:ComEC/Rec2 family competence protein [Microvirga sp.]